MINHVGLQAEQNHKKYQSVSCSRETGKRFFGLLLMFLVSMMPSAHAADKQFYTAWSHTIGFHGLDSASQILRASDGGYLLAGAIEHPITRKSNAYIVKFDRWGQKEWDHLYKGNKGNVISKVLNTDDGGYIVAGTNEKTPVKTSNAWVMKITARGVLLWAVEYGDGKAQSIINSVIKTGDGGYIFVGTIEDENSSHTNGWMLKLNAEGVKLFDIQIDRNETDDGFADIITTPEGAYLLTGYTDAKRTNSSDSWLVKVDAQGQKLWERSYGGKEWEEAKKIVAAKDGNYILVGEVKRSVFAMKVTPDGKKLWDKSIGGTVIESFGDIVVHPAGGYLLLGKTKKDRAARAVKLNDFWESEWDYQIDNKSWLKANSLLSSKEGGFIVAGSILSGDPETSNIHVAKLSPKDPREWHKILSKNQDFEVSKLIASPQGGYILVGVIREDARNLKTLALKIDGDGGLQWRKQGGYQSNEAVSDITVLKNGGYGLAGETWEANSKKVTPYIAMMDEDGSIRARQTYGEGRCDLVKSILASSDGGYLLTGVKKKRNVSGYDVCMLKLDKNKQQKWTRHIGGKQSKDVVTLFQTSGGGYLLVGTKTSEKYGDDDAWVISVSPKGKQQWQKTYGGLGVEKISKAIKTEDGGYLLVGFTTSTGHGKSDMWAVKIDAAGLLKWEKTFGGPEWERATAVARSNDGGYILAGYREGYAKSGKNLWIVKLDNQGNQQWQRQVDGQGFEVPIGISLTNDGGILIAGKNWKSSNRGIQSWVLKIMPPKSGEK